MLQSVVIQANEWLLRGSKRRKLPALKKQLINVREGSDEAIAAQIPRGGYRMSAPVDHAGVASRRRIRADRQLEKAHNVLVNTDVSSLRKTEQQSHDRELRRVGVARAASKLVRFKRKPEKLPESGASRADIFKGLR